MDRPYNPWASEEESSDYEYPKERPPPLKLSKKAAEVLKILKKRTPIHVRALYDGWRELQDNKHNIPSLDKEGITSYAGRLITMPKVMAESVFTMAKTKADGNLEFQDDRIKKFAETFKTKSEDYVYEVRCLWFILNSRKNEGLPQSVKYHRDLGMLMQLDDAEAKDLQRVLRTLDGAEQSMGQAFQKHHGRRRLGEASRDSIRYPHPRRRRSN
jgi:hypothetical protein